MKKLVIWDLDGVITDSEKVWLKNRLNRLNALFNLNWDFETAYKYLGGMNDKKKSLVLRKMGYKTNSKFWKDQINIDMDIIRRDGLELLPYVEKLIKKIQKQCIVTGDSKFRTLIKLDIIKFWKKYFNDENVFTGDMVEHNKPDPDIFLLAAKRMKEKPKNCIAIEDSIDGLVSAQKAGMDVIAFLGCDMYKNDAYIEKVKNLGVEHICYNMKEVEKIIFSA